MACDAQSLINTAYANGYARLSERDLLECIVASACAGGSGGSGAVLSGAGLPTVVYPLGPPNGAAEAVYTDRNTNNGYSWYLGSWHG
jgi:hypothetical protein